MADSQPATMQTILDQTLTVDVPVGYHCLIFGVFYGHLKKSIKVTNQTTGDSLTTSISCYTGWHNCCVITALTAPVTLQLQVNCVSTSCYSTDTPVDVPLVLAGDIGGGSPNLARSHTYLYLLADNALSNERLGITIVVQAGVGPIDVN